MANTYTLIASSTVGAGGAASIDFSSIPGTYTDLLLDISARKSDTGLNVDITFNGSTSGYSELYLYGFSTSTGSGKNTGLTKLSPQFVNSSSFTANTFNSGQLYIPNYAGSNYKSISLENASETNSSSDAWLMLYSGLWASTSAITSIKLEMPGYNFVQYSTAYLYGIKNS